MTISTTLRSYGTLLDALAAAPPTKPFATIWDPRGDPQHVTVSFGEFHDLAAAYAGRYRARGLRPGDTVVLIVPQSLTLLAAFVGALVVGGIPTILAYPTFKTDPEKYRHGLSGVTRNLEARFIVLGETFPRELEAEIAGVETVRLGATQPPESSDTVWAAPRPDDVAFIQHSAGTTGLQKGVALSHRSVLNQLVGLCEVLDIVETDRIVSWLPLYHDMGLIACLILPLVAHLHVVMESPTDWVMWPGSLWRLATELRCTLCWLPNFAFQFLARRVPAEERRGFDLSTMRAVVNCSEPIRTESIEEFARVYALCGLGRDALRSSYAMAENTFAVTQSRTLLATITVDGKALIDHGRIFPVTADHPSARRLTSSGRPLPENHLRVLDELGNDVPDGMVGEVVIRSNSLFGEYYRRPDLTAKVLRDGWYWTGDVGVRWEHEVYVLGRKDDVIIVGGRNLHPQDLESAVAENPDVHDGRVVAFGLFNREQGTQDVVIVAEVDSDIGVSRQAEIQADIRRRVLDEVGVPARLVYLVPPKWIVKSTAGKPARSTTRRKLLELHPELPVSKGAQ